MHASCKPSKTHTHHLMLNIMSERPPSSFLLSWNDQHELHDGLMNENAGRLKAVIAHLKSTQLWDGSTLVEPSKTTKPINTSDIQELGVHTPQHFEQLKQDGQSSTEWFCSACTLANENESPACRLCGTSRSPSSHKSFVIPTNATAVYLCKGSLSAALRNCTLGVDMVKRVVLDQQSTVGMVLSRPPGHHAKSEKYGSYCLINTVVVVAAWLLREIDRDDHHPSHQRDVLILDWDVHHGDGTQSMLMRGNAPWQQRVSFVSIHRHDRDFWPRTGHVDDGGDAFPHVINIPLWGQGYGDKDYLHVFRQVVLPLIDKTRPKAILVSAGFDCASGDALGRFEVTPNGFGRMITMLLETGVPTVLFLEGGYDVEMKNVEFPHESLCRSVEGTVRAAQRFCQRTKGREVKCTHDASESQDGEWGQAGVRKETAEVVDKVIQRMQRLLR